MAGSRNFTGVPMSGTQVFLLKAWQRLPRQAVICSAQIEKAGNQKEKNYWICMKRMAVERRLSTGTMS